MSSLFLILSLLISVVAGVKAADDDFILKPKKWVADFSLEPRVVTGMMYHHYEENYHGSGNVKWNDHMPFLGTGVTLGYNNFFFDIYAQQSATGKDNQFDAGNTTKDHNTNIIRKDYAINFGYRIANFSFFAGYKVGKTDINGTRRYVGTSGIRYDNEETQFETKGPLIGYAYGLPVGESSSLGIKVAYGWLDSDYSSNQIEIATASTSFIWANINWSGPLTKNLTYSLSLDGQKYKMGAASTENPAISVDSITESIVSFKALLSYTFDF